METLENVKKMFRWIKEGLASILSMDDEAYALPTYHDHVNYQQPLLEHMEQELTEEEASDRDREFIHQIRVRSKRWKSMHPFLYDCIIYSRQDPVSGNTSTVFEFRQDHPIPLLIRNNNAGRTRNPLNVFQVNNEYRVVYSEDHVEWALDIMNTLHETYPPNGNESEEECEEPTREDNEERDRNDVLAILSEERVQQNGGYGQYTNG